MTFSKPEPKKQEQIPATYETVLTTSKTPEGLKEKRFLPNRTLPAICSHVRGHDSVGEQHFLKNWLEPMFERLDVKFTTDHFGNYVVRIDGDQVDRVLHVGHLDTISPSTRLHKQQRVIVDKDNFMTLDYKHYDTVGYLPPSLGADDGVAISVMLYLMYKRVSGTYLFTRGEEVGCLGTHFIVDNYPEFFKSFDIALEVDRQETDELICEQSTGKCASDEFIASLASGLNMGHKKSTRGVITDAGHMNELIAECCNIAAGYENQHSDQEIVDITYCDVLAKQMAAMDYSKLVVKRMTTDLGDFGFGNYSHWDNYSPPKKPVHVANPTGMGGGKGKGNVAGSNTNLRIPVMHVQEDPDLENGLTLDELSDSEMQSVRELRSHDPMFWLLNAESRVEVYEVDYPVYTGVPANQLHIDDLEAFVRDNVELIAQGMQDNGLHLEDLGLEEHIVDVSDMYLGRLQ